MKKKKKRTLSKIQIQFLCIFWEAHPIDTCFTLLNPGLLLHIMLVGGIWQLVDVVFELIHGLSRWLRQ